MGRDAMQTCFRGEDSLSLAPIGEIEGVLTRRVTVLASFEIKRSAHTHRKHGEITTLFSILATKKEKTVAFHTHRK
jgi:hypothetical protein